MSLTDGERTELIRYRLNKSKEKPSIHIYED